MAKITIAGDAVVVTSSVKLEDYQKIAKYRPEALTLLGGEDGKEPIFGVAIVKEGSGNINQYGVEFSSSTRNDEKLACLTMVYSGTAGDIKEAVADRIGVAILNLSKLEEKVPAVLAEIEAEKAAIIDSITVAQ